LKIYVKVQNIDKMMCAELRVRMLYIWWPHPSRGGVTY